MKPQLAVAAAVAEIQQEMAHQEGLVAVVVVVLLEHLALAVVHHPLDKGMLVARVMETMLFAEAEVAAVQVPLVHLEPHLETGALEPHQA
jgi:hypothetical protein